MPNLVVQKYGFTAATAYGVDARTVVPMVPEKAIYQKLSTSF
jgi:hypothetical protein